MQRSLCRGIVPWLLLALAPVGGSAGHASAPRPLPEARHAPQEAPGQTPGQTSPQDSVLTQEVEPVTGQRAAQDEAIRNQLQAVFDRVPDLAGVEVTVDAGVVRLEGAVVRSENRERAGELASGLEGVLFLDNRIRESTSLEEQLRPTWTRLRTLSLATIAKLPLVAVGILIMGLAAILSTWLSRWGGFRFLRPDNPFLQNLVQRLLSAVVVVAALLLVLDLLNATTLVGAIVGTAGLAGIALGFAFKDIVENYLAGILLALRQPFDKNDHVRVESFEGKVVRLTARETILMTLEGNHVRLPNALIFRNPMLNFTRNPLRRFQFEAGIGPADDLAHARRTGLAVLTGMNAVLKDPPPEVLVQELGASVVTLCFMGWVDQRRVDMARVRSEAIRRVKEGLEAAGVTLPSPEYLVRWSGDAEARQAAGPAADERARAAPPGELSGPPPSTAAGTGEADLSVDLTVDRQIEKDRRASGEPDLLDPAGAGREPEGA